MGSLTHLLQLRLERGVFLAERIELVAGRATGALEIGHAGARSCEERC